MFKVSVLPRQMVRNFNTSLVAFKQIRHTETDNKILVEGIIDKPQVDVTEQKPGPKCSGGSHSCHPFCKSPLVKEVKHTDVLILNQFVDSKGEMYSQEDLGICMVGYPHSSCHYLVLSLPLTPVETVDPGLQAGPDVSEVGADAGEGVLLSGLQADQVGQPELLLGRGDH